MSEKLLTFRQVEATVGYKETKLRQWIREGKFPAPIHAHGNGDARFVESEIQQWIAEQIRLNRGEAA